MEVVQSSAVPLGDGAALLRVTVELIARWSMSTFTRCTSFGGTIFALACHP
jgi:hypothetical protein